MLVFLVGVFQRFELTRRVNIVAGIDAYLFHNGGSNVGHIWIEMYVGTERHVPIAFGYQAGLDVAQVLRFASALGGEANQLATCLDDTYSLRDTALGIERRTSRHTLYSHAVVATDAQLAYLNFVRLSSHSY